jgi:hypothetical protein
MGVTLDNSVAVNQEVEYSGSKYEKLEILFTVEYMLKLHMAFRIKRD